MPGRRRGRAWRVAEKPRPAPSRAGLIRASQLAGRAGSFKFPGCRPNAAFTKVTRSVRDARRHRIVRDIHGGAAQHRSQAKCALDSVLSSKLGNRSILHRLDWSTGPRLGRWSEPHLYFPRRRGALQSERTQRACPPIGPHGRPRTMPRMRRGDFDQTDRAYGRTRRRTSHVRMQSMPRAASIHRLSRERNYACDATLAGQSRRSPHSNRPADKPWLPSGLAFYCEPPVCGVAGRTCRGGTA
jgi:hypothetical protein